MNARRSNRCTSCSFFSSAPCSGGIAVLRVLGAQRLGRDVLGQQQLQPVEQFARSTASSSGPAPRAARRRPPAPRAAGRCLRSGKCTSTMRVHRLLVGEADVVEEAAAQEGVRQFLLVVRGDDDDRPVLRLDRLRASRRRRTPCGRVRAAGRWGIRCRPCRSRRSAGPTGCSHSKASHSMPARCSWRCPGRAGRRAASRAGARRRRIRRGPAAPWWST